jgi:hypothetical protein
LLPLLARFWVNYPSRKCPRLRIFLCHVVCSAEQYFSRGLCSEPPEWAAFVFSSAVIKAARRRVGERQPEPMGHFMQHISRTLLREIDPLACRNHTELQSCLVDEFDLTLDDVLDEGESEPGGLEYSREERARATECFLEDWDRVARGSKPLRVFTKDAVEPALRTAAIRHSPPPVSPPRWSPPVVKPSLSAETEEELKRQARAIAESRVRGDPLSDAIFDGVYGDVLTDLRKSALLALVEPKLRLLNGGASSGETRP